MKAPLGVTQPEPWLSRLQPRPAHLQQLQQGRGIPVPGGVEEQDTHLRQAEGRGGRSDLGLTRSPRVPPHPSQRLPLLPSGPVLPTPPWGPAPPRGPAQPTLPQVRFPPASPLPLPGAHPPRLSRRRAWRNQRTQACTLLAVCAPSRYQVRGPRRSTCVRPSHSVFRSPGGMGSCPVATAK